jgi:threonine 3-dehydrogenase
MSVLITGGTGFIGAKLARSMVERGEEVILFDLLPRIDRIPDIKDKVTVVQGDLKVWPEVLNVIKDNNVEGIFHLGGMLSVACEASPWAAFEANVAGTMHVLEAARLFKVKRVLFASTAATYSLGVPEVITEYTLQRPTSIYGTGKLYGELLGRFYRRKFGLDFRCLRYFQVMGPAATPPPATEHYYYMIQDATLGKPYQCRVSEDIASPITYFKDGVRAAEMLYYAPENQIKTVCYNVVGISQAKTAGELARAIKRFIPEAEITFKPDPQLMKAFKDILSVEEVDDSCAWEEWGWQPLYTDLEGVVADFIDEVRTKPQLWGLA